MDSFDAAMDKLQKKHESSRDALEGISLLKKQLGQIMGRHGIHEMKSVGNKFDPEKHECLVFEHKKDKEEGVVLEEIQKGYTMRGKIIRHAKVKVNRKN
jgi:molecular chaperone GrpE